MLALSTMSAGGSTTDAVDVDPVPESPRIGVGVARIVASTPTVESGPDTARPDGSVDGLATRVPDPQPGDLRTDPGADVLPATYVAPPAAVVLRDVSYGPDPSHRMDLHLPDVANAPVLAFLHSGGWVAGDRTEVPDLVLRFVERGYAVASIDYRLAPDHPFPAPVHDVKRAIRELKVLGAATGAIDGERIVLYGTSAGGHLAAFTAATPDEFVPDDLTPDQQDHDEHVAGIVVVVGPTDLVQMYEQPNAWARPMSGAHAGCEPCTIDELLAPGPGQHLHAALPPAYWAYGGEDPLVDADLQGRAMADAWAEAAGSTVSWFDLVETGDHNLDETLVNQRRIETFVDEAVDLR